MRDRKTRKRNTLSASATSSPDACFKDLPYYNILLTGISYMDLKPAHGIDYGSLTLTLLTWTIWRAPTNASKWRMGFNPYPANVDNMASSYQC